jgi:hydroxyethylthiazole kinase-like uncharacterized protein yjeF
MADSITSEIWNEEKCKPYLQKPTASSNKYRRGVLGCVTGNRLYPGAALMTTAAALATGVGMVRFLGPRNISKQVINFRPAVVLASGRVDALLIGSGLKLDFFTRLKVRRLMRLDVPKLLDASAIQYAIDKPKLTIITPHHGELARLMKVSSHLIESNPSHYAVSCAEKFNITVLLKGSETIVATPRRAIQLPPAPSTLATAGTGDVLAGILGALLAINHQSINENNLIEIGATASLIHAKSAMSASTKYLDIETLIKQVPTIIDSM